MIDLLGDDGLLAPRPRGPSTLATQASPAVATPETERASTTAASPALCAVCAQRPGRDRCTACGRLACAADLWVMLRLCRSCASDGDVARGQREARPAPRNWLDGAR